jgi:hypothetical protein
LKGLVPFDGWFPANRRLIFGKRINGNLNMPRQMKFWEMVSAFRGQTSIVENVLQSSMWQDEFWGKYQDFERLVERQDRSILDALVPIELSREIAARCHELRFHFDPEKRTLHKFVSGRVYDDKQVVMTMLEVHDEFGGSIIEEVIEKGSANVDKR